jgi:hypothetical protein
MVGIIWVCHIFRLTQFHSLLGLVWPPSSILVSGETSLIYQNCHLKIPKWLWWNLHVHWKNHGLSRILDG